MTINTLFLKKLLVAFVVGFLGSAIQALVNVGPVADLNTIKALWVSLITGAVVAGFRAVLVLLPGVNLVPSDKQPVVQKVPPPAKPTMHRKSPAK